MRIVCNPEEIDRHAWETLLETSATANAFQTPACYAFFAAQPDFQPFLFAVCDNGLQGLLTGYIEIAGNPLKHFFTRRAIILGGPLLSDHITDAALAALLKACRTALASQAIYIEMRNFNDYAKYKSVFEQHGFAYQPHLNFHIDTTSVEVMQGNLGKSRKRDIRTSLRDGATILETPTLADVDAFYGILKQLYATKVKTPLFPRRFFRALFESGFGLYRLVQYNGQVIGGTLCVPLAGKALYEWFACGIDNSFKNIFPSTLATYAGMEYAATHQYPRFDMMGAGKPGDGYGVREFKAKFGGELVEHGRFLCVTSPWLYRLGVWGVKLLKKR